MQIVAIYQKCRHKIFNFPPNFLENLPCPLKKAFRNVRRGEVEYYYSALMIYCIYMQNIPRGEGFVGKLKGKLNTMIQHF